jgi:hypothetical protein
VTPLQESQSILQAALKESIGKVPSLLSYQTPPVKGVLHKHDDAAGDLLSPMGDLGKCMCSSSISMGLDHSPDSNPSGLGVRIDSPAGSDDDNDEGEVAAGEDVEGNNEVDGSIPDKDIINSYGFSDEVEGISVGVFHEIKCPMLHPHEVESARRGIIDSHRLGTEDVKIRLATSDSGYVFWRYKAWILVAERSELLVRDRDLVLYQSGLYMAGKVGILSSMEDVEEVQEWIGLSILSQFNEGRDAMLFAIQEEILKRDSGHKGYEFEDVAMGGGALFYSTVSSHISRMSWTTKRCEKGS